MVCLGNICRSPVAEGILRKKIQENNLEDILSVDSCGTSGYHDGELPDERSRENALKNGLDISYQRSRKLTLSDFERFDKIYCMDQSNYNDIKKACPNSNLLSKVDLLLNLSFPGENRKVPDPYFGGGNGFQEVYELVDHACEIFINAYKKGN